MVNTEIAKEYVKKLHWVQFECGKCDFHTAKWRDDKAGNISARNELLDHIKEAHPEAYEAVKQFFEDNPCW